MSKSITFEDVRRSLKGGQEEALLRKLFIAAGGEKGGEEGFQAILRDEFKIRLEDAMLKLVDVNARCIPPTGFKGKVVNANRDYHLIPHGDIDYASVLGRFQRFFPSGMVFVTADEFKSRSEAAVERIRGNRQVANLLNGTWLPICLPQLVVPDYGTVLEETVLLAVKGSYEEHFPERKFYNYLKGSIAEQVMVDHSSRGHQILERMSKAPVVGIYFPNPMQGFGIPADREMIGHLPNEFVLTGALETATALVAYPQTLARDAKTPALDCAANIWRSAGGSLYFSANGGRLVFYSRCLDAGEYCSGGVLFLG